MKKTIEEWISLQLAKKPQRIVLLAILLFNIVFLLLSAVVIKRLSLSGTEKMGFFEAVFYTITMILDAGCISFVIEDIGQSGIAIAIVCLLIIIIGMVMFTGAVIGYITNYISSFIENSNAGRKRLRISDHFVILNWNTRASEIINDLLFCRSRQKVVVLVEEGRDEIRKEIDERLSDTIHRENRALWEKCRSLGFARSYISFLRGRLYNNLTVLVREGDIFSAKQLSDISLEKARAVIILGKEDNCADGNTRIIKALMLVSDITSADYSADNQKIIVEISDDWTGEIVDRIISYKQVKGKCNIVPIRVNRILGQLLSQFSLMPELNLAYRELFSNKGATFFVEDASPENDLQYIGDYLKTHRYAIPLYGVYDGKKHFFYTAAEQKDISHSGGVQSSDYSVKLNRDYWIEKKTVIILGHNSKSRDIMQGFAAFRNEWNYKDGSDEILQVVVIDDRESLENADFYRSYPFVERVVAANIFEKERICSTIEEIIDSNEEDTSVLILSDDSVPEDDIDANALANLIYVQDIINRRRKEDPAFDPERIDMVVEIIDPRHYDIVSSYSVYNIVISNRYVSKMITQICEKEAIFNFYEDILTYDEPDAESYVSREIYAKKASGFFEKLPDACTASELIRAVWDSSVDSTIPFEMLYPTIVLGYVKPGGNITLFSGDQNEIPVALDIHDKVIVYTNH